MSAVPLLIVGPNGQDTYYTGDLTAGQSAANADGRHHFVTEPVKLGDTWSVVLSDSDDVDDAAEWGAGDTLEQAWRYALGAMFGPVDDEYDEAALLAVLVRYGHEASA